MYIYMLSLDISIVLFGHHFEQLLSGLEHGHPVPNTTYKLHISVGFIYFSVMDNRIRVLGRAPRGVHVSNYFGIG